MSRGLAGVGAAARAATRRACTRFRFSPSVRSRPASSASAAATASVAFLQDGKHQKHVKQRAHKLQGHLTEGNHSCWPSKV